jgi:hypothetical protein
MDDAHHSELPGAAQPRVVQSSANLRGAAWVEHCVTMTIYKPILNYQKYKSIAEFRFLWQKVLFHVP